jgi:hypothetical protein
MSRMIPWAAALLILVVLSAASYGVMQQIERHGADEVPSRLASQVSAELTTGGSQTLTALARVDLAVSLAPFVVITDGIGHVSGSALRDGRPARPPAGVIATARRTGSDSVTWQPAPGLRFATVSIRAGHDVVTSGQSLTPSERSTDDIGLVIGLGTLACALILVIACATSEITRRERDGGTPS